MKKTLLAGASMAVLLTAANALAAEYTGNVETTAGNTFMVEAGSTIKDATFDLKAEGTSEADASRVGFADAGEISVSGENTFRDFVTFEGKTKFNANEGEAAKMNVEGYLTSTRNADVDLSAVDLTVKKGDGESDIVRADGALVIDNDTTAFKVGNTTFEDGTRISLYKATDGESGTEGASGDTSKLAITAGKTVTFEGNNKIAASGGEHAKSQFNISGEDGSAVNVEGTVDVAIDTAIDGADVNIANSGNAPARLELGADNTLSISNSNVSMSGAPDGKFNGIGNANGEGTVVLGENANVSITDGAGIAVTDLTIGKGAVVNASGQMEVSNPENPKWQSGSILQGLSKVDIAEGATVNIADGAQIVAGYPDGKINVAGTVNMSGKDALIRAASKNDGTEKSTLNVSGIVNVLKDAVGIIASRETNVEQGGSVVVADNATLNLIRDMNRGAAADEEPTGDNAKFNVAGSLVNNGIINAEKTDITISGAALAEAGNDESYDTQTAGGSYVSNGGTLNGSLKLDGENTPAKEDSEEKIAAILKAAPKAEFNGNSTVNGNIDNNLGLLTVNQGATLNIEGEGNKVTNNGYIDLAGVLNGEIDNNGNITVLDSAAHMTSFDDGELNISADVAASSLVAEESNADEIYVSAGSSLDLDSENLKTSQLTTYGTTKLGVDYTADAKVGNGGVLDLASSTLTGDVTLADSSTLSFNVDNVEEAAGGKVGGSVKTYLSEGGSAVINPVIGIDAGEGTYSFADEVSVKEGSVDRGEEGLKLSNSNTLYNVEFGDTQNTLNVSKKDSGEVASAVVNAGGTVSNANTVNAWVGGNSDASSLTGASRAMAEHLNTLAQTDQGALVNAVTALAPETAAMVQSNATETANQVFAAVGSRLSGGSIVTGNEGMSSGDSIFKRGAMWVQGLFNHSKADDTRKARGFDADSEGIAFGAEKYVNDDVKLGIGYAYTSSDIDGFMRKTDVDTHTAIAYGEYKPSNWFVNGIATYGWSDYSEKKNVAGMPVSADYDVDSIGLQAMTGYDIDLCGAMLTPEAGLRYVNIRQDGYRDSAGQKVGENTSDILTGVVGASLKKDFALDNGMNLRPEARLAMTYDMFNDDSSSVVTLANGSAYTVNGQALDRFGVEAGVGLTADVNDNVELSLGYEGRFRDHYEDHTGLFNAKYKF